MTTQVVILAAGMGTRLARPHPKPLTKLIDGRTIMHQQLENLRASFGKKLRLTVVVGFKMNQVMEHIPDASFVYNENFDQTNTSKSLLKALRNSTQGGVLWMNGDVVFDPEILKVLRPHMEAERSFVSVDLSAVSDEEVKYTLGSDGYIQHLSKRVPAESALGEAVGINFVSKRDKKTLIKRLKQVREQDYFEEAIELTIEKDETRWTAVDISDFYAVEIDVMEDLRIANSQISEFIIP